MNPAGRRLLSESQKASSFLSPLKRGGEQRRSKSGEAGAEEPISQAGPALHASRAVAADAGVVAGHRVLQSASPRQQLGLRFGQTPWPLSLVLAAWLAVGMSCGPRTTGSWRRAGSPWPLRER